MYSKHHIMDNTNLPGTAVGVIAGIYTSISQALTHPILGLITWENAIDTALLALIGGVVGTLGAEFVKYIKKLKNKKNDKEADS